MSNKKQSNQDLPSLPSVERYKDAFRQLRPTLPANYIGLLRAHYLAPNHTLTARALAAAVGYSGHGSVNLQYGMFGARMRELINYTAGRQAAYIFTSFVAPGEQDNRETLWVLHPQVVQALDELGWFAI